MGKRPQLTGLLGCLVGFGVWLCWLWLALLLYFISMKSDGDGALATQLLNFFSEDSELQRWVSWGGGV